MRRVIGVLRANIQSSFEMAPLDRTRHLPLAARGHLSKGQVWNGFTASGFARPETDQLYPCNASMAFGFEATILSRAMAGPVGCVRRCSLFCNVRRIHANPISRTASG